MREKVGKIILGQEIVIEALEFVPVGLTGDTSVLLVDIGVENNLTTGYVKLHELLA